MIIGINGYIGSGKDTVGAIIQWLTLKDKRCAQINGPEILKHWVQVEGFRKNWLSADDWQIKKFAGKLKQIASLMLGVPVEKFEDQAFKKTFLPREWDYLVAKPGKRQDGLFGTGEKEIKQMTVREFLQRLGTEAIRNGLHTNAWVNSLFADYKTYIKGYPELTKSNGKDLIEGAVYGMGTAVKPNWIITDMRFPNEMQAVKDRGGITIRINRNLPEAPYQTLEQRHPSETALDNHTFDYTIYNDGTIEDLTRCVREILESDNRVRKTYAQSA